MVMVMGMVMVGPRHTLQGRVGLTLALGLGKRLLG